jgi:methyltransferase, FkbM family
VLRGDDREPVEALIGQATMVLDTTDLIQFSMLYLGRHDAEVGAALRTVVREGDVFWDVGANIGAISIPIAVELNDLHVYAFEPSARARTGLKRNLSRNHTLEERYHVLAVALGDRDGRAEFFESCEPFNGGVGSLRRAHNTEPTSQQIEMVTGDQLIESGRAAPPNVIKVDVEGYEREVLTGLRGYLRTSAKVTIIFEHEPYRLRERGLPLTAIMNDVSQLGFNVSMLQPDGEAVAIQAAMLASHMNCIARKQ